MKREYVVGFWRYWRILLSLCIFTLLEVKFVIILKIKSLKVFSLIFCLNQIVVVHGKHFNRYIFKYTRYLNDITQITLFHRY